MVRKNQKKGNGKKKPKKDANSVEENSGSELEQTSDLDRVEIQKDSLDDTLARDINYEHSSEIKTNTIRLFLITDPQGSCLCNLCLGEHCLQRQQVHGS